MDRQFIYAAESISGCKLKFGIESRDRLSMVNRMAKKIALLFAGQGAQVVGMGKDLADQFPLAANVFRRADEIFGRKLSDIAWSGPLEELTKTSNCQPALFVH